MTRRESETSYARLMLAAARLWRAEADRVLAAHSLSSSLGWALVQLARSGEEVRQVDLARDLDISGPSMVRLIDQLEREALVERGADPNDGRAIRLCMTARGRTLAAEIEEVLQQVRTDLLQGVSDEALAAAIEVARQVGARADKRRTAE